MSDRQPDRVGQETSSELWEAWVDVVGPPPYHFEAIETLLGQNDAYRLRAALAAARDARDALPVAVGDVVTVRYDFVKKITMDTSPGWVPFIPTLRDLAGEVVDVKYNERRRYWYAEVRYENAVTEGSDGIVRFREGYDVFMLPVKQLWVDRTATRDASAS